MAWVFRASAVCCRPGIPPLSNLGLCFIPLFATIAGTGWSRATRWGQGFDGTKGGLQGSDWARLELDGAIPDLVGPLPISTGSQPPGATIAVAGLQPGPCADFDGGPLLPCHRHRDGRGQALIAHDCDATRGTSGGPLLMQQGRAGP
jgi:hypothetical protein